MNKRAQSINEYALVIIVAIVALLTMQIYFKRGAQSVIKASVNKLGGFDSGVISPQEIQKMAIEHELDPKYGALKSYEIEINTNQSVTATTSSGGKKETTINNWQESVNDSGEGKKFLQELRD